MRIVKLLNDGPQRLTNNLTYEYGIINQTFFEKGRLKESLMYYNLYKIL